MKHFLCNIFLLIWRIWRFEIDAIEFERKQIHYFSDVFIARRRRRRCLRSLICTPLHYLNAWNRLEKINASAAYGSWKVCDVRITFRLLHGCSCVCNTNNYPGYQRFFLACGGNFRCWPKADTSSAVGRSNERRSHFARVTIKTWQKPETALEKSLAPRVTNNRPVANYLVVCKLSSVVQWMLNI